MMTVEQQRVLLYLDALRIYWVGFEGRTVSRRDIVGDADLAARLHADRVHSIDICLDKKPTRSTFLIPSPLWHDFRSAPDCHSAFIVGRAAHVARVEQQ